MEYTEDQELLNTQLEFNYQMIKFKHLGEYKYPKINLLEIYHREFEYIGKMIQDLGPIASDSAKMQVIASVYNELSKKMKNKWLEKCIEEIIDEDDCKDISCFAKAAKQLFREVQPEDITIDKPSLY